MKFRKERIPQFFGKDLEDLEGVTWRLRKAGVMPRAKIFPCEYSARYAALDRKGVYQTGKWMVSERLSLDYESSLEGLVRMVEKAGFVVKGSYSDKWCLIVTFEEKSHGGQNEQ